MRKLGIKIVKIKEALGLPFYLKSQIYKAAFSLKITSKANGNRIRVILPAVKKFSHQEVLLGPSFNLPPEIMDAENTFRNQYAAWELEMGEGQIIEIEEGFEIQVRPKQRKAEERKLIGDYRKDDNFLLYSTGNNFIHPEYNDIQKLAKKIVRSEKNPVKMLKAINEHVVGNLKYGEPIIGLYSDLDALERGQVDCGGFSALYVSLAIAAGIPSRVVSGFWAGHKKNTMHAWTESLLPDGSWLAADPATEHLRRCGRTKKFGKFGKIGSDRIVFSKGCDFSMKVNGKEISAPILQNPIVHARKGEESFECQWEFITK